MLLVSSHHVAVIHKICQLSTNEFYPNMLSSQPLDPGHNDIINTLLSSVTIARIPFAKREIVNTSESQQTVEFSPIAWYELGPMNRRHS